ncbi:MAG: dual specificity protein phosphatase [Ilumatobacteraceae bacterium]
MGKHTRTTLEPMQWWRKLCWVTPQIALSGDLPDGKAKHQALDEWVSAGITHIIDTRLESSDEQFVAEHAPQVGYSWVGVDDDGRRQPDHWFDEGVDAARTALAKPNGKIVVHCHMGVNRGPSMGFAAMIAHGIAPVEALGIIRAERPIAAVLYAGDAVDWWHRTSGSSPAAATAERSKVKAWMHANPIDTDWITSRIWRAESGGRV